MNLIKEFIKIRDIPYMIPLSLNEFDNCCSWKAIRLKNIFEKEWYEVKYRICKFKWSDLNLANELYKIPHNDNSTHVYLEVNINWKILNVDPTWDKWLNNIFLVNEWDWLNNTEIAVKPLWLFSYEESEKIMTKTTNGEILEDLKENWLFYKAFNEYLERIRISPQWQ
jgi:hypothetical protein